MSEYMAKWHQELAIFSQIKSALILEGDIFDVYPYPEGELKGVWMNLPQYLHTYYSEQGYRHVIQYNHIDGFTSLDSSPEKRTAKMNDFARLAGIRVQNDRASADFSADKNGAPHVIRDVLSQSGESTVVIMNLTSRYVISPDRILPPELKSYTILQQAVLHAAEVNGPLGRKRNMLILIANKKNDIPAWLYLNISQINSIYIDYPSAAERLVYVGGYKPRRFFDPEIYRTEICSYDQRESELHRIIDRFVARTDGYTYFELEQLRKLCIVRKIHISEMISVIDLYTYGIVENPWKDKALTMRLRSGYEIISRRVKGQEDAIIQSLDILKRTVSGISKVRNSTSPKGVLFFAGPTGTGKTETAKALAELVFGDESACIRFDMSEYMHDNSDQRLLGAPPGYIGYEAGGQLTNAVKRNPFSILLFDEIEKACPSIMDKFLQILEDGRMTDGQGNTVCFSDCVIIFTSNLGIYTTDQYGNRHINVTRSMPQKEVREKVTAAIQDHFKLKLGRPEILNRIGENIVVFDYITEDVAKEILSARLSGIRSRIRDEHGIDVDFSAVEEVLLEKVVSNLDNGGRGINNMIEKLLINPLARHVFDEQIPRGKKCTVTGIKSNESPIDIIVRYE